MKIAFLNISQGVVNRGVERFVYELSERLKKSHQVAVITERKILPQRWPVLWRFFIDPNGLAIFWFTLRRLHFLWREKFDVVIPINGGWQPALIRLLTWFYGGKMVISGQSGKGWDDRNNLWSFPDAFVALSTRLREWAKGVNPFVDVRYIPNGVDLDKFKPGGEKFDFKVEKPAVLCVGALTDEKSIDLAIRAVSRMNAGSLVVVGDGPLRDKLRQLGRQLLGERFTLTKSEFERMPKVYRGVDLFTIPSPWYRSFEIVIVEAMATNLPVVVNDDPIRREIVGSAGLFVDPQDTEAYAEALEKALKVDWGNKPRKQAEKFSWARIAKEYEKLFQELIK